VVPTSKNTLPPVNPKKKTNEDHGKDRGRSSWHQGEHFSLGKSPRRGRVTGGSSSIDLNFLGHDLQVAKGVTITSNPFEQDTYFSARPSQVHDAFMELCSCTLVLGKHMTSDLMR